MAHITNAILRVFVGTALYICRCVDRLVSKHRRLKAMNLLQYPSGVAKLRVCVPLSIFDDSIISSSSTTALRSVALSRTSP